jgi:hypothetical protein
MTAAPTVTVEVDSVTVDSVTIANISINYGRTSVLEQPSPSSLSMTMLTDQVVKVPQVGMSVVVTATVGVTDYVRFRGRITTVAAGLNTTQVTATSDCLGRLARLAAPDYKVDGSIPGAGANIAELLELLQAKINIFTYSTGDTTILPSQVITAGSALTQCQTLASYDTAGVLYETPNGDLVFTDGSDRPFPNGTSADVYLNVAISGGGDSAILLDWQAVQSLDGLVNSAVVNYGNPPASITITDATSVGQWGLYGLTIDYPVVSANDAGRKASRTVANFSQPRTIVNPIIVELTSLTTGAQGNLLAAEVGTSIGWLPGPSASGIPGLPEACFIEGWSERITGQGDYNGRHQIALTVSDVALTRTMQTWGAVPGTRTWAGVGGTVTWYQTAGTPLT